MAAQQIGIAGPEGTFVPGLSQKVISGVGATRTLLASESGALCLFDAAAGNAYTLPTPAVGLQYFFQQTVSVTSNASKVTTAVVASQFLLGAVTVGSIATASAAGAAANGTSITSISSNGTTTGGLIGSYYKVTAVSTTQWVVEGYLIGSGVLATPFA